jgi:hypothetical protein
MGTLPVGCQAGRSTQGWERPRTAATAAWLTSVPPITALHHRTGRALGWDPRFGHASTFFGTNGQPLGSGRLRVGDGAAVLRSHSWAAAA